MSILYAETPIWFAYSAFGLLVMAGAMGIHMQTNTSMPREPYLLIVGAILGAIGCIVGGMQTGANPLIPRADGIAAIRVLWAAGITLGIAASVLYIIERHQPDSKEDNE